MIEQRFGGAPPFSLGVEEELMILDAGTYEQVAAVDRILRGVEGRELPGRVKTELFASVFETNTNVCTTVAEVEAALPALRRAAAEAAEAEGLAIAAAATHPFALPEAQPIVKEQRYVTFVGYGGISVRRQGVQGLHVHVGMASADECWRCLEAITPWLPVVLALSANSPWFAGTLTGMASNRAPVLAELPRAGGPPAFSSYAEWESWVERLVRLGVAEDYTRIWWDVRPHPKLGTLEVRSPISRRTLRCRRRSRRCCRRCARPLSTGGCPRRHAWRPRPRRLRAEPLGGSALRPSGRPAASGRRPLSPGLGAGGELLELVTPAARTLGGAAALARIDPAVCEADLQLQNESAAAAAADLVARTLG